MRIGRTLVGVLSGSLVAVASVAALPVKDASAARGRRGGPLRLVDVDVGTLGGVRLNAVVEMRFTQAVRSGTVGPATVQIRARNATGTGFTKQVPGDFQVIGRFVRFFPRLPTHLRDPDDPEGGFYPYAHERDDAEGNAGFQPGVEHEIRILGHPTPSPIRSRRGRRLNRSYTDRFTAATATPKRFAYTTTSYQDPPPPAFQFSNPPDKVATVTDQYAQSGGTRDVPNAIGITLFGNKVPISPSTLRQTGNVRLNLTQRLGDRSLAKPIQGQPFIEQNFDTTRVVFQPNNALSDLATYALRVSRAVKDLTEDFDFKSNDERLRLRTMYEFLAAARNASPGTPPALLQDPPADVIVDWPRSAAERSVLKANLLALGDANPEEVDPRVMILFSTRDEPVTRDDLTIDFESADGHYDAELSTGSYDDLVQSAASAIQTAAAGSGVDGDYAPTASEIINAATYENHTINWRNVVIPPGVVVRLTGTRPVSINALQIRIEGELRVDGSNGNKPLAGVKANSGGTGGPGGGAGGDRGTLYPGRGGVNANVRGMTGNPGVDKDGVVAAIDVGGQGGQGGQSGNTGTTGNGTSGAAGGGGGGRLAGTAGSRGWAGNGWSGAGGVGGAGSSNDTLVPLVGGAGGGSGGNFYGGSTNWEGTGATGGGGGGALRVTTATLLTVGTEGLISAAGGRGGGSGPSGSQTSNQTGGAGGGGGGGSLLLRSSAGFNLSDPAAATDVRGGGGGSLTGTAGSTGGVGGDGYVRLEDPNGGLELPGGSSGTFDPVGGGVPSVVYTKFIDIGVDGPRILNFEEDCFILTAANDAILIEVQFAIEDPGLFGSPKTDAIEPNSQGSTNEDEVSQFLLLRVVDNSRINGGAFPTVAPVPANQDLDEIYDIAEQANGKNYRFVRYRITFQLDDEQMSGQALPNVDLISLKFEFNF